MVWLLITVSTAAAIEIFLRTPFRRSLGALTDASARASKVVSSSLISDHWKQLVLPRYALTIFKSSLLLLGCLLLTAVPVLLADLTGSQFGMHMLSTLATPGGLIYSLLFAALYVFARAQILSDADYSPVQKLLHYLALSNPRVGEMIFDAEMLAKKSTPGAAEKEQHVFISGLARSGTTILMRSLYDTGQFASLTYADMPFVLAPNIWGSITHASRRGTVFKERPHMDGILVNQDSPEALEEIFWQVFARDDYVTQAGLQAHEVTPDVIEKYRQFVSAVIGKYGKTRYIAKNNNNILRLKGIHSAFPDATILVPFRDPVQHAYSLLRQHRLFNKKQGEDPFVRRYMSWLGHYEFGLTHRPFDSGKNASRYSDTDCVEYWLEQWDKVYRFLADHPLADSDHIVFISYERLCAETDSVWKTLCGRLNLDGGEIPLLNVRLAEAPQPDDVDLLRSAARTYAALDRRCMRALQG